MSTPEYLYCIPRDLGVTQTILTNRTTYFFPRFCEILCNKVVRRVLFLIIDDWLICDQYEISHNILNLHIHL
jgi:hypothetical protein